MNGEHAHGSMAGARPEQKGLSTGVRIAMVGVLVSILGVGGLIAVRAKQAVQKKKEVAAERAAVQERAAKREPSRVTSPVDVKYRPRVDVTGTLKPWREADLGFQTQGRMVKINTGIGESVKSGKVLGILDASLAGAQVAQAASSLQAAQANLALAEDAWRRTEALSKQNAVSEATVVQTRQQLELARANVEGARASVSVARTSQGQHSIVAPFDGIVTKAPTGIGAVVNPGMSLFRVEDASRFRLSVTLGEEDAWLVEQGSPVQVSYRDKKVTGKVSAIVRSLDPNTRRAPLEVEVPNTSDVALMANTFVRASVEGSADVQGVRIPPNAHRAGSQDEILLADGGKVKLVRVAHSVEPDGSWIVRYGLTSKDVVLLDPSSDLLDGDAVEVAKSVGAESPR